MKSTEYFMNGYSCSESIIKSFADSQPELLKLLPAATAFSGGLSSGCLCGAISASILVIGHFYGKGNAYNNEVIAKTLAKEFIEKFKAVHSNTCCRALSGGFETQSPERKLHCCNFVEFCSKLLDEIVNPKVKP